MPPPFHWITNAERTLFPVSFHLNPNGYGKWCHTPGEELRFLKNLITSPKRLVLNQQQHSLCSFQNELNHVAKYSYFHTHTHTKTKHGKKIIQFLSPPCGSVDITGGITIALAIAWKAKLSPSHLKLGRTRHRNIFFIVWGERLCYKTIRNSLPNCLERETKTHTVKLQHYISENNRTKPEFVFSWQIHKRNFHKMHSK